MDKNKPKLTKEQILEISLIVLQRQLKKLKHGGRKYEEIKKAIQYLRKSFKEIKPKLYPTSREWLKN